MESESPVTAASVWSDGQLCVQHLGLSDCNLMAIEVTQWLSRIGAMAPWVKVSASRPDDLNSMPRTHTVEGENRLLRAHHGIRRLARTQTRCAMHLK